MRYSHSSRDRKPWYSHARGCQLSCSSHGCSRVSPARSSGVPLCLSQAAFSACQGGDATPRARTVRPATQAAAPRRSTAPQAPGKRTARAAATRGAPWRAGQHQSKLLLTSRGGAPRHRDAESKRRCSSAPTPRAAERSARQCAKGRTALLCARTPGGAQVGPPAQNAHSARISSRSGRFQRVGLTRKMSRGRRAAPRRHRRPRNSAHAPATLFSTRARKNRAAEARAAGCAGDMSNSGFGRIEPYSPVFTE